jgi:hypothetical protein
MARPVRVRASANASAPVSASATPNAATRTRGSVTPANATFAPAYGGLMVRKSAVKAIWAA